MKKVIVFLFALILCFSTTMVALADSSFVTSSDGKSYDGLPEFPTDIYVSAGITSHFYFSDYVLVICEDVYFLWCFSHNGDGTVYHSSTFGFCIAGTTTSYDSSGEVISTEKQARSEFYYCSDGVTWVHNNGYFTSDMTYTLIQSSCTIYTDSTGAEVFFKSAMEPLISGLSSTTLAQMTMTEIHGLIPLVLGFLTLAVALWKGWTMLRQVLAGA